MCLVTAVKKLIKFLINKFKNKILIALLTLVSIFNIGLGVLYTIYSDRSARKSSELMQEGIFAVRQQNAHLGLVTANKIDGLLTPNNRDLTDLYFKFARWSLLIAQGEPINQTTLASMGTVKDYIDTIEAKDSDEKIVEKLNNLKHESDDLSTISKWLLRVFIIIQVIELLLATIILVSEGKKKVVNNQNPTQNPQNK